MTSTRRGPPAGASGNVFPPHHTPLPHLTKDNWREEAAKKRQSVLDAFPMDWFLPQGKYDDLLNVMHVPRECGLLSEAELAITEIDDVVELAAKIAKKELSAVDVAKAFCKRAAIAHQLVNCLTEVLFDRALARARELDDHLAKTGQTLGPLHGVPISLKDQFDIKDVELTMGYAAYLGRISPANSSLVDLLEASGAVLYVRTNIPQTLMIGDTTNHIFGRTVNPRNRKNSPGGSSGGEGALIALKGSILGIGTDIGGSVRIPSAFNGLFTIRPCSRRVPYGKATNSLLGQESVLSVAGPMCRTLNSVEYFMRTVLNACAGDYDASAFPMPFNDNLYRKTSELPKLAFGYAKTDGHVHSTPPAIRAIDETIAALKKAGHEVIEFDVTPFNRAWPLAGEIFCADGGQDVTSILSAIDEPLIDDVILGSSESVRSVYHLHQMNREKEAIQQAFLQSWLNTAAQTKTGRAIDGLIFPTVPSPVRQFTHDKYAGLTGIFNILDLPSCVVPVTKQDPAKDPKPSDVKPFSQMDKRIQDEYDADFGAGLPATVQIVGRRWQEEPLLAVTKKVVEALGASFTE